MNDCTVQTDALFTWYDLVGDPDRIKITEWEQNADDGWCEPEALPQPPALLFPRLGSR